MPRDIAPLTRALKDTTPVDQLATAGLLEALFIAVRLDYEDRYLLASILARIDRDRSPQAPRYWDFREKLNYRLEWDDQVRRQL